MRRDSPITVANSLRVPASRSTVLPYAMLASAQIAVGAAAIFARFALSGAPPLAVAAWRLIIASAVLLVIAGVRGPRTLGRSSIPQRDTQQWIFVAAGVALAVHFASWIWSLDYTSVAVSTLLVATTPIWTALYDSAVHKRHLSPAALGAFALGGAGLVLVVGFNQTNPPIAGHHLLGSALALIGAIAIGAYFVLVREVREGHGTRAIVTRTYSWAALVLLVGSLAARQAPPAFSDAKAWGGILAMALISQLLGHTALNASLRWFSPSAVGMSTLLEPVTAALLAFFIFAEKLTPLALCGGVLVLIAIGVFLREERAIPQA
ncbi:MAG TPA: EamA family transporter [Candidatus Baltobacteraceae bacterium]|nr:EamA family transporter [Candidatus Baltobacteraceae bacterium]